jgi:hypothetical protein
MEIFIQEAVETVAVFYLSFLGWYRLSNHMAWAACWANTSITGDGCSWSQCLMSTAN